MSEDIKRVYTGSKTEGMWIQEILKENGIGSILKDLLETGSSGGLADAAPEDATQIFVETFNYEKSVKIIEDYFKNRKQG